MRYFQEALSINLFPLYFFTIKTTREHFFYFKALYEKSFKPSSFFSLLPFLQKTLHKIRFHHQPDMAPQKSSSAHIESIYFCFYHPARRSHFHNLSEIHATSIYSPHTLSSLQFRAIFYFYLTTFLSRTFMDLDKIFYSVFFIISAKRKQTADTRSICMYAASAIHI